LHQTQSRVAQQPLSGYRVLDLSGPIGVYCGKLMADMGADVIKIEPPNGDPMRLIGPFVDDKRDPERSIYWLQFNTNKRSITLDIQTNQGGKLFQRLAAQADIILETFKPGFLESMNLGYNDLRKKNPGLIFVSITPFGKTGPYSSYVGSDLVGFAMGGYMYVTGWPHTPPTRLWGSQAYHTASNRAFIGALIAIYDRLNTNTGQEVDVSMQEAVAATTEHVNIAFHYEGNDAVRCGFRHGGQFVATWKCKDGYTSITTNTQKAWDDLREWMAQEGMVGDLMEEKYSDRIVRRGEYSEHIEELIQKWALNHTREEITQWGQERHHPFGPVAETNEILENTQLWARGFFVEVEHPEFNTTAIYPGAPYKLPNSPWHLRSTAPKIGQHNTEIYHYELGISPEEIERMTKATVI
jgi:benzylsuccinate CoA-transferase BbsE subunit